MDRNDFMMKVQPDGATLEELAQIKLFHGVDVKEIQSLLNGCDVLEVPKGTILQEAGQVDEFLYFILSGRLRIQLQKNDDQPITILEDGDSLGEIAVIDKQPTSGYVVTDIDTRVLRVNEEQLWSIVEHSHTASRNLLRTIAYRLRFGKKVMNQIQSLLREFEYDATIDPLTGFYNRRWLGKMLVRLIQRCQNGSEPLSVIMMDLDHFKKFNDSFGHLAGDRALNTIAKALVEHLRPEDTITRYGGEEFIALLPGSDLTEAKSVAERLRLAVDSTPIYGVDGKELPSLTISMGIAQMSVDSTPEQLIEAADRALYRAKRGGRDQVSE